MAKPKTLKVCVILPAYNEAAVIKQVLRSLPKAHLINDQRVTFQPLVIDDGSTDGTAKEARKVPRVVVVRHLINMGAGAATRTGIHYAKIHNFDLAVTMDADGQHAASDLIKLLAVALGLGDVDLLVGGRLAGQGYMPLHKRVGNRLLSYMTFALFGTYVSDSQSGFRVFSKRALHTLQFNGNGYAFCSEMLWQAKRTRLKIGEHPIQAIYTDYSKAKGQKSYSGGIKILQQLVSQRLMEFIL